jgi:hypothetical protein
LKITNENGDIYHFINHSFRHTYAIKLLNAGADFIVVKELLAHVSPEMTLKYAKLLDDTKRKTFESIVEKGVFSFNTQGSIERMDDSIYNKDNIMDMLWLNHKLSAVDTPYGICLQRKKGQCKNAIQPVCLTCNGGQLCNDLLISPSNIPKYEIHMDSAKKLILIAESNNNINAAQSNNSVYEILKKIHTTITSSGIIFGNINRVKEIG